MAQEEVRGAKPAKKGRNKMSAWGSDKGWKAVSIGDEFLLGAEDGGFAGLEVLDDPTIIEQYVKNVPVETPDEAAAAGKPGKKAKQAKGKDKQADKQQQQQQQQQQASDKKRKRGAAAASEGDAAAGADSDVAALKARLVQLEAENAQLKKAKKQKAGAQKPDAATGTADTTTVAKKEQKKGKQQQQAQQQQQQQAQQAAAGKEGAAGEPAAEGEAAAGEVKLSKTAARKLALKEARKAKKEARKEAKQAAKQPAAPNKQQQHAAAAEAAGASSDMRAWAPYCLHPVLLGSLALQGFSKPTPIQQECMQPAMRDQLDIIGAAQTGSGKTLAFGLPILQKLLQEREAAGAAEEAEEADAAAEEAADGEDDDGGGEEVAGGQAGSRTGRGRGSPLRALIMCPTRELALQVCDHMRAHALAAGVRVAPIVGGLAHVKQQRMLKQRPAVVVATPGRLWELMRDGEKHLTELQHLSFLVLDEADRMVQQGHYQEMGNILDLIPHPNKDQQLPEEPQEGEEEEEQQQVAQAPQGKHVLQTFVFSATLTLPLSLRKRLRKGGGGAGGGSATLENLMNRLVFRGRPRVVDLTTERKVAEKVSEAYLECSDADRDEYLYYILAKHPGRTIVFVNAVSALRRVAAILKILGLPAHALHAQQQQRQRLKALDRFKASSEAVLVASDVAARGLDVRGVDCVIHYQLPASADTYIHRSGRTGRAEAAGISIALVTPQEAQRFLALTRVLARPPPPTFPLDLSLMKEVHRRVGLALKIDAIERGDKKDKADKSWMQANAEAIGIDLSDDEEDEEGPQGRQKGRQAAELTGMRAQLGELLAAPLQPSISRKFFTGGVSALGAAAAKAAASAAPAAQEGEPQEEVRPVPVEAVNQTIQLAARLQQSQQQAAQGAKGRKAKAAQQWAAAQQRKQQAGKLLVSRNQMKKKQAAGGRGLVVIPAAFGRDAQAPNALEALKQRLAVLG